MKTPFTIIDTKNTKVISSNMAYIELMPAYVKWLVDYKCVSKEEDTLIEEEECIYNLVVLEKNSITSIILYRITSSGNWCVECDSCTGKVNVMYKKEEYRLAKLLFDQVLNWRYNVEQR